MTYVSLYLPPGRQMETLRAFLRRGPMQGPISLGGDVNVCIAQPKNEQEADIVAALMALFTMCGGGIIFRSLLPPTVTGAATEHWACWQSLR
eukprot:4500731-Lingulodinium_polyedra.AAC.1